MRQEDIRSQSKLFTSHSFCFFLNILFTVSISLLLSRYHFYCLNIISTVSISFLLSQYHIYCLNIIFPVSISFLQSQYHFYCRNIIFTVSISFFLSQSLKLLIPVLPCSVGLEFIPNHKFETSHSSFAVLCRFLL